MYLEVINKMAFIESQNAAKTRKSTISHRNKNKFILLCMAVPCVAFLIVFNYIPLIGWGMAFFDYKPGLSILQSEFVGLKYFALALKEPELLQVLINTFVMSSIGLLLTPLPAVFAILLSEVPRKGFRKLVQTTVTLPYFISWILVFSVCYTFMNTDSGMLSILPMKLGFTDQPVNYLANANIVWGLQAFIGMWKGIGFSAIIYLAAIVSIDPSLYDAAHVDGAGRFGTILHITIPGIMPTFFSLLILAIGNVLSNGFEQYYVFYNPIVHEKIQVLDYYLWRVGFMTNDMSFSTALGMSKTIFSIIILFSANQIIKKLRGQSIL